MAFKLKLMAFPIKLTPNGQNQGKNNRKIKYYIAAFAFVFKKISVFLNFFEFLDAYFKKSTGMRKSQVGVVFQDF